MLSLLFSLSALAAKPDLTVPPARVATAGSQVAGVWDCERTTIDASDRKGRGHAACLRSYQVDAQTGATLVQFTVVVDSNRDKPLDERNLWIELDRSDKTRRRVRFFGTSVPTAEVVKRTAERGELRQAFDVVFSFDTFDLPSPIASLELKVAGEGSTTWGFTQGLAWPAAQAARVVPVTQNPSQVCGWDVVTPRETRDVAAWLTTQRSSADLHLGFDFALDDDDGEVLVELPRQGVEVLLDQGRLVVKGAETFDTRLTGMSLIKARPTPVALDFDGDELLVTVGQRRFGPLFVRRRAADGRAPEVVLALEGAAELQNLQASMCTPVPEVVSAPPPPPPPPPPAPVEDDDTRVTRSGHDPVAELARIQAQIGGISASLQVGGVTTSVSTTTTTTTTNNPPPPPPPRGTVDYASLEITGLSPAYDVSLDGQPLGWNDTNGSFYAPQYRDGQRLRVARRDMGLDWSADGHPEQLGMHEVCHFVPTPPNYAISCRVTGPVQGMHGNSGGFGGVVVEQGPVAMGDARFADLLRRVDDATFSRKKLDLIGTVVKDHHFSVRQVGQLMEQLDMDNDKVEVAITAYPVTVDPENWYQIYDHLTFSSSKDDLRKKTK